MEDLKLAKKFRIGNKKRFMDELLSNILVWVVALILITPLILIVLNSFKTSLAASDMNLKLPDEWVILENYKTVIEKGKLGTAVMNSLIYSLGSVFLTVFSASLAAYIFSRNRSKLNRFLYFFFLMGLAMPINYIALVKVMQVLHLTNSRMGLILLYTAVQLPFNVFIIYGFISKIPRDIDEAAVIDGCGPVKLFFLVIFPLLKPVVITAVVLTFLHTWNEFVLPLYFTGNTEMWPMTLAVYNFFGRYERSWNLICADIVMTSLPVIAIYLVGQKYIVSGMVAGSVKG